MLIFTEMFRQRQRSRMDVCETDSGPFLIRTILSTSRASTSASICNCHALFRPFLIELHFEFSSELGLYLFVLPSLKHLLDFGIC